MMAEVEREESAKTVDRKPATTSENASETVVAAEVVTAAAEVAEVPAAEVPAAEVSAADDEAPTVKEGE
jgi:hypothetical protein